MKLLKLFIISFLLVLIFSCTLSSCLNFKHKKSNLTLVIGTSPDYPPYESIDKNGNIVGFDIDLAIAIANQIGREVIIKQMAFDSLILALEHEKIDIIISGISSIPSRRKKIDLISYQSKKIKKFTLLFWEKLPLNIENYDDLKNIKKSIFCVQSGTIMSEFLRNIPEITVKTLESTADLLLDIIFKKSLAALVETNVALTLKKQKPQLRLLTLSLPKKNWIVGYGIGIKKNNKQLKKEIEKALLKIKSQGLLEKIEEKWFKT